MINAIHENCEILKLSGVLQCYQSLADESLKTKASYTEYLDQVLKYEVSRRDQRSKEMQLKIAGFPVLKRLDQFDYNSSSIEQMQIQSLSTLEFINNKENIIFIGSPGTGKTHLAIGLGHIATQNRLRVKFITTADLLLQLESAQQQGNLSNYLKKVIGGCRLLIIDEFGYLKLNENQSNLLFQIINNRYETGSIIITSNLTFSKWEEVLNNNEGLTAAIMDRLIHHSHIININGDSYRLKQKRKAGFLPIKLNK